MTILSTLLWHHLAFQTQATNSPNVATSAKIFAGTSVAYWYYHMTKPFWINYLYYTSYTTPEFLRLVVKTFSLTMLHELLGGGRTEGKGILPFPFEAATWQLSYLMTFARWVSPYQKHCTSLKLLATW